MAVLPLEPALRQASGDLTQPREGGPPTWQRPHNSTATAAKKAAGKKAAAEEGAGAKVTVLPGVGLVDLNAPGIAGEMAERLAGSVGEQLLLFATRMQEA